MRKCLAALMMISLASDRAVAVEIDDILGRWCQTDVGIYTFTRTQLSLQRMDGGETKYGPVMDIDRIETKADQIRILWKPVRPDHDTVFVLSADKRRLIQLPDKEDNGPRREFHRC
jgi:hypothetical protein